jgi:hypothetical protein
MAKHVNAQPPFEAKYGREIEEFKKCFIDYVRLVYPQMRKAVGADGGIQQAADGGTPFLPPIYPSCGRISSSTTVSGGRHDVHLI